MISPWRRACWLLSASLAAWCAASSASAQPAPEPAAEPAPVQETEAAVDCRHDRYIALSARAGFDPDLAAEVRKDMAAELGLRGYGACAGRAASGELVAEVWLSLPEPGLVSIEVDDHSTGKWVSRDVPLNPIPAGGKALAIAIAVDELLRASWAELSLRRPEQAAPVAAEPAEPGRAPRQLAERRVVNARAAPGSATEPAPSRVAPALSAGLMLGYLHAARAWDALNAELRAQLLALGWLWAEAGVGGFGALRVDTPLGQVAARGLSAAVTFGACAPAAPRLTVCAGGRGGALWIHFRGLSPSVGRGREGGLGALLLSGVGQLRLRLSERLVGLLELGLGGAPLGARAGVGSRTLMGIDGFALSAGVGVGLRL